LPSFKNMGPACCCCNDTLIANEQRYWCELNGDGTNARLLRTPKEPTGVREAVHTLNYRPAATNLYAVGTAAPDWKNKRLWYSYIENYRPIGPITDKDSVIKWWDVKASGSGIGTTVTTLSSYLLDAMAADPDNEHLYYAGTAYPYPDMTVDYSIDLCRINFDGTGQTTLDTVAVFRTGSTTPWPPGIGSMLVNRPEERLYYVVLENVTTSTADDWQYRICYRDFATFTETTIYSVQFPRLGVQTGDTWIRLLHCLSFDLTDGKIYWVEHYLTATSRREAKVRRANLDGSGVELLYQSADPYRVNFARYSNKLGKIVHGDYDRTSTSPSPLNGIWLRDKASWATDPELIALQSSAENLGEPYAAPNSSFLWCGYEGTTA
jgi:hypothetical protein